MCLVRKSLVSWGNRCDRGVRGGDAANDATMPVPHLCVSRCLPDGKGNRSPRLTSLEACARQLLCQHSAILDGLQAHRQGRALHRNLRRQGESDARQVFRRPLPETGQLVRTADGEGVAISKAHIRLFLNRGRAAARRRVRPCSAGFDLGSESAILAPRLHLQFAAPGSQQSAPILRIGREEPRRRARRSETIGSLTVRRSAARRAGTSTRQVDRATAALPRRRRATARRRQAPCRRDVRPPR